MNKKISQFPGIITLQDGYLIPAVKDGVNYVFNTASLKSYLNKTDVGLSAVDNTSDINKPISAATQTAISGLSAILFNKTDIGHLHSASDISDLTNMFSGYSRTNHTHVVADITDLVLPNMNLYATVQDMLARTTEARVLQLITQNTTGAVDLGPTNIRIDNAVIRIAATEAGIAENQITTNTHNSQISSLISRLDTVEASGLDVADLQNINNQFTVLTNSLTAKANISHTHTTTEITDFAVTVGNLIASVINVNAINADLNGIHTDLLAIHTSLDGKADTTHLHSIANITGLQAALDAKSGITHVHDFNGVTGLQTALDGKANVGHIHTEYAPITHNHVVSEVNGLQTALDAKTSIGHVHQTSDITGLNTLLASVLGEFAITAVSSGDIDFNSVVLLLHGGGTNNSTNIVDSSSFNKIATIVGNTAISTTQSKFSGSSLYFDGNGSYISYLPHTDFDLGTNHTFEAWVYHTAGVAKGILSYTTDQHPYIQTMASYVWHIAADGLLKFSVNGSGTSDLAISTTAVPASTWSHIAVVKTGQVVTQYVNGFLVSTDTLQNSGNPTDSSWRFRIGTYYTDAFPFNGYIDDLRITKGVARYSANFTPIAQAFPDSIGDLTDPNFADVVLLLHAEGGNATNSFVDSSPLPATLTTVGSVMHTTGFKKFGNSSIETSDKYSKIQVVKSSNIDLTGNYTIECFVRTNSNTNIDYNSIITTNDNVFPSRYGLDFGVTGSNSLIARIVTASNTAVFSATNAYTLGDLAHIAFVNNNTSNIFNIFINGVLSGTRAAVPFFNSNTFQIAKCSNYWAETPYQIDELRITKNVVRYTANFTPPTAAFLDTAGTPATSGSLTAALAAKAPLVHNHALIDITGLQNALDAKASVSHTHTASNITDFSSVVTDIIDQQIIASNSSTGDTYYNNVVLLLHGTGANNSTVFTDSSPTPKTITVYGNAKISTTQSKFSGSSLYFDGSGDYLSIATSQDFDLGNVYTIEFFVYNLNATSAGGILHKGYYSSITHLWSGFAFSIRGIGTATRFYFYASTNVDERYIDVPASLPQNAWQHVAMVRNGSSGAVYIDGVPSGTITGLNSTVPSSETLRVGLWDFNGASEYFNGHLAEVRVTKGVARYTAAFAPPTIEFPNINSGGGTPGMLSTALTDLAAQIAAINSGSGSGASSSFTRMDVITSSGSWTIPPGVSAIKATVIGGGGAGAYGSVSSNLDYSSGGGGGGGGASVKYLTDLTPGATLLATVGNGGVSTNGSIGQGSVSKLASLTQSISTINADGGDGAGRVINCDGGLGSLAAYIAASGDPYYSNVSLLLHMDGANNSTVFTDNSPNPKTVTVYGNAKISTTQSKFSGSSLYCDGNGDYIEIAAGTSTDFNIGLSDFVVETFYFPTSSSIDQTLIAVGEPVISTGANLGYAITHFGSSLSGKVRATFYSGTTQYFVDSSAALSLNVWNHIAFVRISGVIYLYVNGVQQSSLSANFNINTSNTFIAKIGKYDNNTTRYLSGYLDELRITKGVGRYATGFTPVVSAFPNLAAPDTFPMTGSSVISIPGNSGDNGMFGSIDLNTAGMQNAKLLKGGSGGDAAVISAGGGVYNPISASYSNGQAYGAGGAGGGIVYNSTTLQYSGSKGGNGANGVIIIEY